MAPDETQPAGIAGESPARGVPRDWRSGRQGESSPGAGDAEADGGEPTRDVVLRWLRRASIAGLVLSLAVHAVVALVAALVLIEHRGGGRLGGGAEEPVEFAVMTETELAAIMESPVEAPASDAPTAEQDDLAELSLLEASNGESLNEFASPSVDVELSAGGGDITGGGSELSGTGGGGEGKTSFFGLEAEGSRFAYIVDRSSSMRGPKMTTLKAELIESITSIVETGQFVVVFYSDGPTPLGGSGSWREASRDEKATARREIANVPAGGSTRPLDAFRLVLGGGQARPDAIYLMSDGEFTEENVPGEISAMNRRYRIPVHCVLFETQTGRTDQSQVEQDMRLIARQSGGRFVKVDVAP